MNDSSLVPYKIKLISNLEKKTGPLRLVNENSVLLTFGPVCTRKKANSVEGVTAYSPDSCPALCGSVALMCPWQGSQRAALKLGAWHAEWFSPWAVMAAGKAIWLDWFHQELGYNAVEYPHSHREWESVPALNGYYLHGWLSVCSFPFLYNESEGLAWSYIGEGHAQVSPAFSSLLFPKGRQMHYVTLVFYCYLMHTDFTSARGKYYITTNQCNDLPYQQFYSNNLDRKL